MKYTSKITASLLAALLVAGTVSAVPSQTDLFGVSVSAAYSTYSYADGIQYKLYNNCVKVTWDKVSPCTYYLIQVCSINGMIYSTYYAASNENTVVIPYTCIPLDADENGRLRDTQCCVSIIGIYGNNVNESNLVPYIDSTCFFTVKPDMSGYEAYGKPGNLKASCTNSSVKLSWENTAVTKSNYSDTFHIKLMDSKGNTVYSSDTKNTSVTINKLLYNNTYTATVTNKTYNASSSIKFAVKVPESNTGSSSGSDSAGKPMQSTSGNNSSSATSSTPSSSAKLPAPKNLKAKSGDEKIVLTWSKVSGADAYRVYIFDETKGKYVRYKTVKGTKCTVTGLIGDKNYKFRVAGAVYDESTKKYTSGNACAPVTARYASKEVAPSLKY